MSGGDIFDSLISSRVFNSTNSSSVSSVQQNNEKINLQGERLFQQLCEGLKYLHDRGLAHLDLKPENILCNESLTIFKIADFDSTVALNPIGETYSESFEGTALYMPPECVDFCIAADTLAASLKKQTSSATSKTSSNKETNNGGSIPKLNVQPSLDMWSLGVLMYEFYTLDVPFFGGREEDETYQNSIACYIKAQQEMKDVLKALAANVNWKHVPAHMATLIQRLCSYAPDKRPTSSQLRKDLRRPMASLVH
jgi:serine/threonine protein kinase